MTDRIMLVEDEMIVAMDVQQRLEKLGYEVAGHAISGEEAIRCARKENPNLILMDIKIRGEMDGIEAAARIRETLDIPVIYITAFSDEATLKRARLTEAYGYLIKPFDDRDLRSAIEIAIYKHMMEKKLHESEERYMLAARAANDGIWDWNLTTNEVYYSTRWKNSLGLPEDQLVSSISDWLERVHPEDIERLNLTISDHLKGYTPVLECEYRIMHQDGGNRWMLCRGLALFDDQKRPYRIAGSQSDITSRKQIEEQLIHRALHDELTSLPNRALFTDRLRMILENAHRTTDEITAVLFLDVDNFKVINDSLGHISGDELLIAFAQRIKQCLRSGDTVSRFGGDEFAILVNWIEEREEAIQIADRICIELRKPFFIQEHEIFISASIGIVFVSGSYHSVDDLLRDVDTAMYFAKSNGRSRYAVFDASMHDRSIHRLQQEAEIRRAIIKGEFTLHYQPIYVVNSMELAGFEALIRWEHPVRGQLLPGEFIRVVEETGLVIPIGEWVLRTACMQAQAWQTATGKSLKMSVNLSALQFNDKNLLQIVRSALAETGLDPRFLELELTESVAMNDIEKTHQALDELQQMGVSIAIDDFGSGYSSFEQFRFLPANLLKIDRSFISDMKNNGSAIVAAIMTMAHQLKLKVVAEGVETKDQLSILASLNCDQAQGFYLGRPIPHEQVWEMFYKSDKNKLDT